MAPGNGANTGDGSTSFTGLANAPEANLFIGAATVSVPFEVPPARGITPKLALSYSSASGAHSPYGSGWDLPIGRIQRCAKKGVLSCDDSAYRNDYVVALPDATIECTLQSDNRCYPLVEESFLRIQYNPTTNSFTVWDKTGTRFEFGSDQNDRRGSDPSQLFVPAMGTQPCKYTSVWGLSRVEDTNGNEMTVRYESDDVLYPNLIIYGGNTNANILELFRVRFHWAPSSRVAYNGFAGFLSTTARQLRSVVVDGRTRAGTGGYSEWQQVRRYQLTYNDEENEEDGQIRLIQAITQRGKEEPGYPTGRALLDVDGQLVQTAFLYNQDEDFGFGPKVTFPELPISDGNILRRTDHFKGDRAILDMNGDGIPDLVDV